MYCSKCGSEASGNFCWSCGTALQQGSATPFVGDWSELVDYATLVQIPEVRQRISLSASRAKPSMTGEEFMERCDKVLAPLMGGVSTAGLARICQPLYAKLGLASTKTREQHTGEPVGRVIVNVLCSMAEHDQKITQAIQMPDGCVLEASIPSDIYSFAGDLSVHVKRLDQMTSVTAIATIKGQKFDWGKTGRCVDQLFSDLNGRMRAA